MISVTGLDIVTQTALSLKPRHQTILELERRASANFLTSTITHREKLSRISSFKKYSTQADVSSFPIFTQGTLTQHYGFLWSLGTFLRVRPTPWVIEPNNEPIRRWGRGIWTNRFEVASTVNQLQRVNRVPLAFGHLLTFRVADKSVQQHLDSNMNLKKNRKLKPVELSARTTRQQAFDLTWK